jgi:D-alanyl-D-alanine carboxypeptidase
MRALVLPLLLVAPLLAQQELSTRLQQALAERLGDLAPGAQAAVALPDGTVVPCAAGVTDRATKAPMPNDGRMLAGSTGKTFFAALACQLVNEKKLDLDAKVATWFGGDDATWFTRLPNHADITPRHLLMHRSGLMRYEFDPAFTERLLAKPDHCFTPREELAFVLDKQPRFAGGAGFDYSDTNYVLLGLVLEKVTGTTCQDEIARRFVGPLGLSRTLPSTGRRIPGLLQGHAGAGNPFGGRDEMLVDGELPFDPGFEGAGGGYATTASDLARWARALYGGDVLGPMLAQVVAGEPAPLGKGTRYGLGCIVDDTELGPAFGHRGFFPGWLSEMRWFPERRIAVAVLVNSSAERRLPRALPEWTIAFARLAAER